MAQSNRGDLLSQQIGIGDHDDDDDVTIPQDLDLTLQEFGTSGPRPQSDVRPPLEESEDVSSLCWTHPHPIGGDRCLCWACPRPIGACPLPIGGD
ncbi:hypothetical protein AMEX_G22552 [Astyanax mexicanus]|uniref:Uncharacterized protein n=1 Tax=Astyanax mexicanus TaxID=7994 RepID=A0A8T2L5P4_ASTMX|nr:hypothetical protein AMEX_G22552 [Astyanax mexicanus]